ncbi:MAG: Na+/H+ antiporter NhaC family protein [Clostridia bacterium]|nr:Na+/H+ antiporter NhaC family protein [Clostridia bacterium]
MIQTAWALLPPIIAIVLALITKEVYVSLFIGILTGALLFTGFQIVPALETTFTVMADRVYSNLNIVVFLVLLGMIVALMNHSGASRAYGEWASKSIRSKRGALYSTMALGVLIFVDDYFNCLTVGTVMRPVTDRYQISRAKLAYIIDATAAPVCIIAPISSWAAAVGSSLPEGSSIDGFTLFLSTIPFNYYALLTIAMVIIIVALNFDFGPMKNADKMEVSPALKAEEAAEAEEEVVDRRLAGQKKGQVKDLLIPILTLIGACIFFMLQTGGIFEGVGVIDAFAGCDSALSLVLGSVTTILVTFLLYIPRGVMSARQFAQALPDGFKAMVPAILILTFAWTLSGVCSTDYLDAGGFVSQLVRDNELANTILPPAFFLIAMGLAFATGTSWGTFGILIPIAIAVFEPTGGTIMTLTVAAILAGAVCGDHISPISDTTILASTGADCSHIVHVSTQMPYALLVAACCTGAYILAGLVDNGWVGLAAAFAALIIWLLVLYRRSRTDGSRQGRHYRWTA